MKKSLGKGTENIIGQQSFVFDLGRGVPLTLGEVFQFKGEFPEIINSGIEEQIQEDNSLITFEKPTRVFWNHTRSRVFLL